MARKKENGLSRSQRQKPLRRIIPFGFACRHRLSARPRPRRATSSSLILRHSASPPPGGLVRDATPHGRSHGPVHGGNVPPGPSCSLVRGGAPRFPSPRRPRSRRHPPRTVRTDLFPRPCVPGGRPRSPLPAVRPQRRPPRDRPPPSPPLVCSDIPPRPSRYLVRGGGPRSPLPARPRDSNRRRFRASAARPLALSSAPSWPCAADPEVPYRGGRPQWPS